MKKSLVSICLGVFAAVLILFFTAKNPISAITLFFTAPFANSYYFGSWLNTASLLIFASLGASFALQSGSLNLGGEGQIYLSGFITALIINGLHTHEIQFVFLIAFMSATFFSGLIAYFCGILKVRYNLSEILTTFLASAGLIPLIDGAIAHISRVKTKNLLSTEFIAEQFRLTQILPPSTLNSSFFIAVFLCFVIAFLIYKTKSGYVFRMSGIAPEFAFFSGFEPKKSTRCGMFLSGAFHGMAGFFAVVGTYYTCYSGFYAGIGWNALTAALIAKSNPALIIFSSLIMAFLTTAANRVSLSTVISYDISGIASALILLFISAQFVLPKKGKK